MSQMPSFLGADPHAMRRAAHELETQADCFRRSCRAMTAEVNRVWWKGDDAERFKSKWTGVHQTTSERVVSTLVALAHRLRSEAAKQEATSRAC